MANLNEAIEAVRNQARVFQAVIDLAESLGEVQNVEQAIAEANVRLTKLRRETDVAQTELSDAKAKAKQIVATAESKASKTITDAEISAAAIKRDLSVHVSEQNAFIDNKYEAMYAMTSDSEAKAQAMNAEIAGKSKELEDIEAKIARATAKMKELLGA